MPTLTVANIPDFVASTLPDLGKPNFSDLMSDYQNTIILKRTMKKGKTDFKSGKSIDFGAITNTNDSFRMVGIGEQDQTNIPTLMTRGTVPWRFCTWNWSLDRRVLNLNREPARIMEMVQEQRIAAFASAIIGFERQGWRCPDITDEKGAFGFPYWIVKSNTDATAANNDGFNGLAPSGYTLVGGLNPTTLTRWRNYATQYTNLTKDDFVRKARRMKKYTDFMPLVDETPVYNTGDDYGQYTNYAVVSALEEILESQNENLGNDVASMEGKALLGRVSITWAKELDLDTTNPFYSVNFGEFKTAVNTGEWQVETHIPIKPGQHTVSEHHVDCTFNWICRDRRRNGVLATNTTMGY